MSMLILVEFTFVENLTLAPCFFFAGKAGHSSLFSLWIVSFEFRSVAELASWYSITLSPWTITISVALD